MIVWICKVNFRDPKQFILHVCERVRDRNERKWWVYRNCLFMPDSSWADPEGDRPHPWKIGFLSILVRFPLKSQSYQASIRCWAISGTPAKRHLNDDPYIVVFGSSLPSSIKKKVVKVGPLSGSVHAAEQLCFMCEICFYAPMHHVLYPTLKQHVAWKRRIWSSCLRLILLADRFDPDQARQNV